MSESVDRQYEAFVRLFTQHETATRAYIRNAVRSWDDVDDIMQEISIAAWRKFATLDDHVRFAQWLTLIARYEILSFRRKRARDRHVLSEQLIELILDEDEIAREAVREKQQLMEDCLSKLPKRRRELLEQIYSSGQSVCEFAEHSGQTATSLYQLVSRMRRTLSDCVHARIAAQGGDL